jgi:hypothetical protein
MSRNHSFKQIHFSLVLVTAWRKTAASQLPGQPEETSGRREDEHQQFYVHRDL